MGLWENLMDLTIRKNRLMRQSATDPEKQAHEAISNRKLQLGSRCSFSHCFGAFPIGKEVDHSQLAAEERAQAKDAKTI
jgi:hypothetical protein